MNPEQYWRSNERLAHITPAGFRFPEVGLHDTLKEFCIGKVLEFGCGDGRLAPCFEPSQYVGYDINEYALKAAKINNPSYTFQNILVPADTVLAYTVLLHIDDNSIQRVIETLKGYKRIVIGEIMGRHWRRDGLPPVFNRSAQEYVDMIDRPFKLVKIPYKRYNTELDLLVFDEAFE